MENIDIAISFLSEDEDFAQEIESRLSKYFDVFLYSKRQSDLAGTDGMETFSNVFKTDSKTVLVLYREKWGNTKWTGVEMHAIKDRCFNSSSYDFLLFIPLDTSDLPVWVPETLIYYDHKKFGLEGLIPVAHAHLKRNGVAEKKSGLESLVSQIDNQISYDQKLENYLRSSESVEAFNKESKNLVSLFTSTIESINENADKVRLTYKLDRNNIHKCYFNGYELGFYFKLRASNAAKDSILNFKLFRGIHTGYEAPDEKPDLIREVTFKPSLGKLSNFIWSSNKFSNMTTSEVVEKMLQILVEKGGKQSDNGLQIFSV